MTELLTRTYPDGAPYDERSTSAIESPDFPFEAISDIAEVESWRKEIYRPTYHLHKWWAQRLGSVFRAILLGAVGTDPSEVIKDFYGPSRIGPIKVFDPFMGSGTTIGETLKLGGRALGRDINPVAYLASRTAHTAFSVPDVVSTYVALEAAVSSRLRALYSARTPSGDPAETLYYFWVKVLACPLCGADVELFTSRVFARHAYPRRVPTVQASCPHCGEVVRTTYDARRAVCGKCEEAFDPQIGSTRRTEAQCSSCSAVFQIARVAKSAGSPPRHRMFAKLVLVDGEEKVYLPADEFDRQQFEGCKNEWEAQNTAFRLPDIEPGENTNQVLNYGYRRWDQMFNVRQLMALTTLSDAIRQIETPELRDLFTCLFSGTLEFNNLFASYKGEGTGAVRHMFAHHILKPERMPIEANVWGTPKSSGSFSTLFRSRVLPAVEYAHRPFEVRSVVTNGRKSGEKVFDLSCPMGVNPVSSFADFKKGAAAYLSCGDSSTTDIESESINLVVTDPPFFDNVNYSELADFFFSWQRPILDDRAPISAPSTRSSLEVQSASAETFSARLRGVFAECHRVLRPDGLLIFTYHHSRAEGWEALLNAITGAGFVVTASHPVKAEMAGAMPKNQAGKPIDVDVIVVCRKRRAELRDDPGESILDDAEATCRSQIERFARAGRNLMDGDLYVAFMAQVTKELSCFDSRSAIDFLRHMEADVRSRVASLPPKRDSAGLSREVNSTSL